VLDYGSLHLLGCYRSIPRINPRTSPRARHLPPLKWLSGFAVDLHEGLDRSDQLSGTARAFVAGRRGREDPEPQLNLIEPGGVGVREVEMHRRMPLPPRMLVNGKIGAQLVEADEQLLVRVVGHNRTEKA